MQKILITWSITPDIDAVACAIGYQHYLSQKNNDNNYVAGSQDGMHPEADFVCKKLELLCHAIQPTDSYDSYIIVDASAKDGLPDCIKYDAVQEVIDHRMFPDYAAFPYAKFRIEPVGAAATQVAEFFYFDTAVTISPEIAQLLLCAIYSNTVNFKADVTTFRDHRMKQWLEKLVVDTTLYEQMFTHKTAYILDNLEEVLLAEDKDIDNSLKLFQLELYDADLLLQDTGLLVLMQKLNINNIQVITILQDIQKGETLLVPLNDATKKTIDQAGLPWWRNDNIWQIPHIMMRKTLIPYLKNIAT